MSTSTIGYYLVAPTHGQDDTKAFLVELTRFAHVAPTTTDSLRYAAQLTMHDFEDAMQVAAAMACDAEVIATRRIRSPKALLSPVPPLASPVTSAASWVPRASEQMLGARRQGCSKDLLADEVT